MPISVKKSSHKLTAVPTSPVASTTISGRVGLTRSLQLARTCFSSLIFLFTSLAYSQEYWFAGVGASLEPSEELLGVNLRGYYGPNEVFCFGPEISIFPYQTVSEEEELSLLDLNVNAHYVFEVAHRFGLYPIAGVNYSIENTRGLAPLEAEEERINAFGLNYGAGLHYNLNKVFVYAEYKGIISELNAPFITAGVIIDLSKKESEH